MPHVLTTLIIISHLAGFVNPVFCKIHEKLVQRHRPARCLTDAQRPASPASFCADTAGTKRARRRLKGENLQYRAVFLSISAKNSQPLWRTGRRSPHETNRKGAGCAFQGFQTPSEIWRPEGGRWERPKPASMTRISAKCQCRNCRPIKARRGPNALFDAGRPQAPRGVPFPAGTERRKNPKIRGRQASGKRYLP